MNWNDQDINQVLFRFLSVKGVGSALANKVLATLKAEAYSSCQLELAIGATLSDLQLIQFKELYSMPTHYEPRIGYLNTLNPDYPTKLRASLKQNMPPVLSCMGNLDLLSKKSVGFSGSRKVSDKGIWITRDCVKQLVEHKICVISGYANGVDLAAHHEALRCGGRTILVLPEGISHFYIRRELQEVWDWNRVLVISEFLPADKWMASRAMKRNLTIIALSDSMIVVEAGETGGSLDAGLKSLSMNKRLFVPQYADAPFSALGNNVLLEKGASPLLFKQSTRRVNLDGLFSSLMSGAFAADLFA